MATDPRYGTRQWKALRLAILARDGWHCQIRTSKKCKGVAGTVDHIKPTTEGGPFFDPANLRAACRSCNSSIGARAGWRRSSAPNPNLERGSSTWMNNPSRDW